MCGIGALLVGRQTASYRIWDGIRSLDYLASRPEVDPTKLGCTGNSGGGTLTAYLMALDDRIVAGAPSCYITSLERLFATIGPQDAEQNITGQVAFGMEHADFITMRAPKPTLICTATKDFFDIQGSWTTFREVKRIYGLLGHGERVDLFEYDDQHGFSKPRREAACRWMLRWLAGRDEAIVEGDFPANQPADLQCTRTGQVLEDLKGKSVFDLNGEREMELAEKRPSHLSQTGNEGLFRRIRDGLRLGTEPGKDVPTFKPGEPITRRGYEITQYTFMPEASIVLPGMSWQQTGLTEYPPEVMYLHDKGMLAGASLDGPFEKYVKAGYGVWTFDLRGLGELAPAPPSSRQPSYFGSDSKEVFLSLHVRRPLLGQRVYDVLATVERLMPEVRKQLHLTAVGSTGPVALHAAALDPRIKQLTLDRSLISWSSVVRTPISVNQLTNVVPGALEYYDLPDLAATLAPRPLTIRNPVDAAGQPVSQEELERVYARAREAYAKANAADKLILEGKK
jgi:cephalosporin-C deacetylase-like acetyl esterase